MPRKDRFLSQWARDLQDLLADAHVECEIILALVPVRCFVDRIELHLPAQPLALELRDRERFEGEIDEISVWVAALFGALAGGPGKIR